MKLKPLGDKVVVKRLEAETTTKGDIDQGIVNIWVGFAPARPAEFVILRIRQTTGQVGT